MTTPTTNRPSKSTKSTTKNEEKNMSTDTVDATDTVDSVNESTSTDETPTGEDRIPEALSKNSILADFCRRYLEVFDEVSEYNKAVLAEKDSEWNASKVLTKAREFASPEKAEDADPKIKAAMDEYERLVTEVAKARKNVLDATSEKLGISLSAVADRDASVEAPLKEKRKLAIEIGTQLSMIAKMTTDETASDAVTTFLANNPLPAIGRDQTRTFTNDGKSTPKYRVTVTITKDGNEILKEDGFTKTALALTKPVFGYERGKAPKSETLREVWEKAGNTPDNTVQSPVEFDDNNLHYSIAKK